MAHFFSTILTSPTNPVASRVGNKRNGMTVRALSYQGVVETRLWHDADTNTDMVCVYAKAHPDADDGKSEVLYRGPVAGARGA